MQHEQRAIVVDDGWFKRSVQEKLHYRHFIDTPGKLNASDSSVHHLASAVQGQPNEVLYRCARNLRRLIDLIRGHDGMAGLVEQPELASARLK